MAINNLSYGRHGLRDWLLQRVSAVIIAAYFLFLVGFWLTHPGFDYDTWMSLFARPWVSLFSLLFLISLFVHAWIGIWIVATDYLKGAFLRYTVLILVALSFIAFFAWGVQILWSVPA